MVTRSKQNETMNLILQVLKYSARIKEVKKTYSNTSDIDLFFG